MTVSDFARALDAEAFEQDLATNRYSTTVEGIKVTIAPGMATVLVGNESVDLLESVTFEENRLLIPAAAAALVRTSAEKQAWALMSTPKNYTVVIDPGHIGFNKGGFGFGLWEKDITLKISRKLAARLRKSGFTVRLTRTSNEPSGMNHSDDLESRAALANKIGADIFVSIHGNECDNPDAHGFEVWYTRLEESENLAGRLLEYDGPKRFLDNNETPRAESEKLEKWRAIVAKKDRGSSRLAQKIIDSFAERIDDTNRGVKDKPLRVTRRTFCPAVLVEVGFLSHEETCTRLKKPQYRTKMADAIAAGIEAYWKETAGE